MTQATCKAGGPKNNKSRPEKKAIGRRTALPQLLHQEQGAELQAGGRS